MLRQRVFAAAFSPCLQIKICINLFADSRGNIPDEGLNTKNSRPCRIRNVRKQARQKILTRKVLARKIPAWTRTYGFLTRQKARTSSAILRTDQKAGSAGERCSKYPFFELRPVLN
jgi:hypothetical protein